MAPSPSPEGNGGAGADLTADDRAYLLDIAARSIERGFDGRGPLPVDPDTAPPATRVRAGAFVTVTVAGELNGCIGTIEPIESLVATVARCAWDAAFDDPRLPALQRSQIDRTGIEVSVLSPMEPIDVHSEAELVAALRPGVDGLLIDGDGHRATFLPAVWEQVPEPELFVHLLERKAGLWPGTWSPRRRAYRYTATKFGNEAVRPRRSAAG
ncbi:MAG TPA: AmmeMemoRadiSam system protein A [Acidimicrobiales bacterium]|nr:AmmeMemoRadiSam system protein A [Acidimicrobiales bacterium]